MSAIRCVHAWDVVSVDCPQRPDSDESGLGEWVVRYRCLLCDAGLEDRFCICDPLIASELMTAFGLD